MANSYNFDDFFDSFFSMFALQTTTNYPDIMLVAYSESRLAFLFFFFYILIQYFLLMNLIAGVYYFNYKNVIAHNVSSITDSNCLIGIIDEFLSVETFNLRQFSKVFKQFLESPGQKPLLFRRASLFYILSNYGKGKRPTVIPLNLIHLNGSESN